MNLFECKNKKEIINELKERRKSELICKLEFNNKLGEIYKKNKQSLL